MNSRKCKRAVPIGRRALRAEGLEERRLLSLDSGHGVSMLDSLWQPAADLAQPAEIQNYIQPDRFETFSLNGDLLTSLLAAVPFEAGLQEAGRPAGAAEIALPNPGGGLSRFAVVESPVMAPELAAKFPEIKTYQGTGIDDPAASLRFDVTPAGFHAQVLSPSGSWYIDPYGRIDPSLYVSYFRQDYVRTLAEGEGCGGCSGCGGAGCAACETSAEVVAVTPPDEALKISEAAGSGTVAGKGEGGSGGSGEGEPQARSGAALRTYRLAVAATGEYTAFHGGTVSAAMAAIVTAINRVTGIYEIELAIRLSLVANNHLLVYTNAATDPYTNNNANALLSENQTNIDTVIGNANYDIGHVFSTGGGGLAGVGVVGRTGQKARGETGLSNPIGDVFYVDYVAHEMGHQFGANHTFNGNDSNRNAATAYEPGSGSTIMSYAGIMGSDNLQANSDAYFHSSSFDEIIQYTTVGLGNVVTPVPNGNNVPTVNAGPNYTIPARTPFALTATGSDADPGTVLTYNWEQRDLGPQQAVTDPDNGASPLFRSFLPTTNPTRTFPRLSDLLNNTTTVGEKLPTTTRAMNFRATVRDNRSGGGGVNTDDMVLNVIDTGAPFSVTSPNTSVSWMGGTTRTITWNVAGTTAAPISAALVNIRLSTDGGNTFPILLAVNTPNDGSESVTLTNVPTTSARIKVEPVGNVFFDISDANFTITLGTTFNVVSTGPASGSLAALPLTAIDVNFSQPVAPASIGIDDLLLSHGSVVSATALDADTVRYTISGVSSEGVLTATLPGGALTDLSANPSEFFNTSLTLDVSNSPFPGTFSLLAPAGSGIYRSSITGVINSGSDTDSYTVLLDAGQTLTVLATASSGLRPGITVTGPGAIYSTMAPVTGSPALLQSASIATAGTYTVSLHGVSSSTGSYTLELSLNTSLETESQGGGSNHTQATAQNLDANFVSLVGAAARAAVLGNVDEGNVLSTESEPNNSTATANDARLSFTPHAGGLYQLIVQANRGSASDVDFFKLGTLQAGDVISISYSGSASQRGTLSDPLFELRRGATASTIVASSDDEGPGLDSLIYRFTVTTTDTYYIRATAFLSAQGSYELGVYLENAGDAPLTGGMVIGETENNDTGASANDFSTSWRAVQYFSRVTGNITSGDIDVFAYQFSAGDLLTIHIDSTSALEARVSLLNAGGASIATEDGTSVGPGADSWIYSYRIPSSGTYYVQVQPQSNTGAYNADLYLSAATPPPQPTSDFYAFSLANGETATLAVKALTAGTMQLELQDIAGVVALSTSGSTSVDRIISNFTATTPGVNTYFARVYGSGGTSYSLTVARNAAFDAESNDTVPSAQLLGNSLAAVGAIHPTSADADVYSFQLASPATVTFFTLTPGDGAGLFTNSLDPGLDVFGPGGALIASNENGAPDNRNAQFSLSLGAGTHSVRVRSAAGAGEYILFAGAIPALQTIDNGASGFHAPAGWSLFAGQGVQNDVHFAPAGAGSQGATWSFAVNPGQYRVAATWSTHANRATDAPFTIFQGSAPLVTVRVDQEQAPNDFSDAGTAWEYLGGILNVAGGTLTVRLSDIANEYVIADAVRLERLGDLPAAPEIQVLEGTAEVTDGGSFSFGSTLVSVPVDKTFRVRNIGAGSLTVQPVSVPAGFSVVANIPAGTVLASGAEVSFTVRLLAAGAGSFSGELSFANTDANENPYNFNISGSVGQVQIIDNGQSGFQSSGGWAASAGQGLQDSVHFASAGSGSRLASWTFTLTPGQYRVAATWSPHANRATNAPYTLSDATHSILSVAVDQTQAPSDFTETNTGWKYLGGVLNLTGTTLVVSLSDAANRYVIADAVRLERIGDLPTGPEIQVFEGAAEVLDGSGVVNLGTTFVGVPLQKTFRVKNIGAGSLTLQSVSVAAGFSVVTNIPSNTQLASGAETTFTVQMNAAAAGNFSGELSFSNTDTDENPFNFTISGTVGSVKIIDNGDAGFSTIGAWTPFPAEGYQNDVHYTVAGSGAHEALWTFAVSPGQYRVAATWSTHSNRATNAPFTVYNGNTALPLVTINQQLAPNDLTDAGANWEYLGGVLDITATMLIVKLTDQADAFVIADAIRLQRLGDLPGGGARPEKGAGEEPPPPPPSDPGVSGKPEPADGESAVERGAPAPTDEPIDAATLAGREEEQESTRLSPIVEQNASGDEESAAEEVPTAEEVVGSRNDSVSLVDPQAEAVDESPVIVEPSLVGESRVAVQSTGLESDLLAMDSAIVDGTNTPAESAFLDDILATLPAPSVLEADESQQPGPEPIIPVSAMANASSSRSDVVQGALLNELQTAVDLAGTFTGRKRRLRLLPDMYHYVDVVFALDDWQVG